MTETVETYQTRRAELDVLRILPELLTHHLERRPELPVYKYFDPRTREWTTLNVRETCERVLRWRHAFAASGLSAGDRVAMLLPNCIEAILFDQAALSNALVPVPLHAIDTPGSSAYILNDSGARVLVVGRLAKWKAIRQADNLPALKLVIITDEAPAPVTENGITVTNVDAWLAAGEGSELPPEPGPDDLAAVVYTSGTTGRPKGVMLTHRSILADITSVLLNICPRPHDVWLSFLPLSHTFERTTTYYAALGCGNLVAFNRSIGHLLEDIRIIRPSILMSVPRIYEKAYAKIIEKINRKSPVVRYLFDWAVEVGYRRFCRENGLPRERSWRSFLDPLAAGFLDRAVAKSVRDVFGGRPYAFITGGAALNQKIMRTFQGLGIQIFQGYGLTEASPIVAVNKFFSNNPSTVGPALKCNEVRIGENEELQIRGPNVMVGYWQREPEYRAMFTEDGWLKTGDQAVIYDDGHIRIKGRIKEIIVTSTGEKVPPVDLEQAMETDPLIEQSLAIGEGRPFITALVVVNPEEWETFITGMGLDPEDPATAMNRDVRNAVLRRIKTATATFPNYGVPRNVRILTDPWTIENGMLTPTLKLKRGPIFARYREEIEELYGGRG